MPVFLHIMAVLGVSFFLTISVIAAVRKALATVLSSVLSEKVLASWLKLVSYVLFLAGFSAGVQRIMFHNTGLYEGGTDAVVGAAIEAGVMAASGLIWPLVVVAVAVVIARVIGSLIHGEDWNVER
ncbi:MAG: hypothetical protein JSU65_11185 [Candidatus Zixiibacteriota bacterium]|nr:MAG: hypothetical protein JSU65_11185 [candidate division Zixibacteria bacterium]